MKKFLLIVLGVIVIAAAIGFWQVRNTDASCKALVKEVFAEAGIEINGSRPWDITVHNEAFYSILVANGSLGLGETYMEGMWDCPSIEQLIFRLLTAKADQKTNKYTLKKIFCVIKAKLFNLQNKSQSLNVINMHYNLGNDLYIKMLGPAMAYSCGYWKNAKNLDDAQYAKYDLICRKLKFKKGMKVLDIGCGFGTFAKYAAENYGVTVVGVTLSENQAEYGRKISEGLPVTILVQDYRDLTDSYDRIVSIGMFEHVGPKNYRIFMEIANRCLKDDGLFLLHTIGGNADAVLTDPWINKYIFPGGVLPSISQIGSASEGLFVMEDWHNFGLDYAKTLMAWHTNFNNHWNTLSKDYSPTFYRMWNYYLLSCAATFQAREIQLWQIVFSKNRVSPQYFSER